MARHLGDDWLLPQLDPLNESWYTAGHVSIQECRGCGGVQHPPYEVCRHCQGTDLGWRRCSGRGRIESVAVVHHPVHPALTDHVPYAIAVVSIDDAPGAHAIGNVLNRDPSGVEIGQQVRAVFEPVDDPETGDRMHIPQWEVVD